MVVVTYMKGQKEGGGEGIEGEKMKKKYNDDNNNSTKRKERKKLILVLDVLHV
jgi:hypothetical protein